MKKIPLLLAFALLCAAACHKTPATDPEPGPDVPGPAPVDTTSTPVDTTEAPDPLKPDISSYTLHTEFSESFSGADSDVFEFSRYADRDDFRYFTAFPSWNDRNVDLLLLRIDPDSSAGLQNCIQVLTKDYTYYGSYSARLRLPDIAAAQPDNGIKVALTCTMQDETFGYSTIELMWKMADPSYVYMNTIAGLERFSTFVQNPVEGFKPCGAYITYGFDWSPDKVEWWIMSSTDKVIIGETSEAVPYFPSRFGILIYHSKNNAVEGRSSAIQPPYYPYEFEIDKLTYKPL